MFSESMARSGDPSSPKPPWGLAGPMAQPCLDATRFSAHPCRGNAGAKSHLPALFSPPRDPPGAPRTSASPRCTRRAGSAAKPATWARGWCSPAGSTRPSASPAWTVSTCSPPTKGVGHRGGFGDHQQALGSSPCASPWASCVDALRAARCSLPVPNSCTNAPKWQDFLQDFPQSLSHLPSKSQPQIQQPPCSRTC